MSSINISTTNRSNSSIFCITGYFSRITYGGTRNSNSSTVRLIAAMNPGWYVININGAQNVLNFFSSTVHTLAMTGTYNVYTSDEAYGEYMTTEGRSATVIFTKDWYSYQTLTSTYTTSTT